MYSYTMTQWLFLFYFYCFLGWCVESVYVSLKERPPHFINRGFMRGPFLPLYGSGAIMMLVVSAPFQDNLFLTYVAGCIGATILEYITGVIMEALFKMRYWDYSNQPFNFQGHICLGTTLSWGFLTILMTHVIHKPIEGFLYVIPVGILEILVFVLTVWIDADFAISFRAALDIRDIVLAMERAKEEMARMQKRLDVLVAVREEEIGQYRSVAEMRIEELIEGIEGKLHDIRERRQALSEEYLENAKNEASEIRERFQRLRYHVSELKTIHDRWKRSMILGNPGMKGSLKVRHSLEELKEAVKEKLRGD